MRTLGGGRPPESCAYTTAVDKLCLALEAESHSVDSFNVYDEVDLPHGAKPIPTRWVHVVKPTGELKSRLVVKGYKQQVADLDSIYASTTLLSTMTTLLSNRPYKGYDVTTADVCRAFLRADRRQGTGS